MEFLSMIVFVLLAALVGVGLLLYGYRAFFVLLPVFGFFGGFWMGAESISLLFGEGFLATITGWVVGFLSGLVVAVLSYLFYWLGVAIVAGLLGAGLTNALMTGLGFNQEGVIVVVVSIVAGVALAILAMRYNLQKYVVTALTALAGSSAIVLAILVLIGRISLDTIRMEGSALVPVLQDSWFWLLAVVALAIFGIYFQLRNDRTYRFSKAYYVEGWG